MQVAKKWGAGATILIYEYLACIFMTVDPKSMKRETA
jgi:hypothetical protein